MEKEIFKSVSVIINRDGYYCEPKTVFLAKAYPVLKPKRVGKDIRKQLVQECGQYEITMIDAKHHLIFTKTKSLCNLSCEE